MVRQFFETSEDGLRLFARVTPSAAKDEVVGLWHGEGDETRLAVKVTAPPDKGKANAAVIKLLSKSLGLPKSSVSIIAGETSRRKTLALAGDEAKIAEVTRSLIGENE